MSKFENKTCRFCLNVISGGNFQVIGNTIKEVVRVVLPKLNLDEETKCLICSTCFVKLKAALDFKSMCLDTDDCIIPYMNDKTALLIDLKEVYMKEKGKGQCINMPIDQEICRLCMRLTHDEFTAFCNVDVNVILRYIPELNFHITKDPVICKTCLDSLSVHSRFINDCLDGHDKFENLFDNKLVDSAVDTQFSDWCLKKEEISIKCEDDQNEMEKLIESSNFRIREHEDERNVRSSRTSCDQTKVGDLKKCVLISEHPSDKRWHECNSCDYKSKTKHQLTSHMLKHKSPSEIEWHECNLCDFKSKYKCNLRMHMTHMHKPFSEIQWHKCNSCSYKSKRKSNLTSHLLTHKSSENRWYKCNSCDFKSELRRNSKMPVVNHKCPLEIQWHECNLCNYKSKRKNNLQVHMVKHTSSETKWYECNWCNYKSKHKNSLEIHLLQHKSPSEIQWQECKLCDYKTKRKSNLKIHMVIHTSPSETKWYECNLCNHRSKLKNNLRIHMKMHKSHSEIEWLECNFCNFKSKYKKCLEMHLLKHKSPSEIPWYECSSCSFKSKFRTSLERHKLNHKSPSEIKWHECNSCSYKAKYKELLKTHMLIHKPEGVWNDGKNRQN